MTRTRQDGRVPYSDDFHVMAVDWQQGQITGGRPPLPRLQHVHVCPEDDGFGGCE